MRLSDVRLAGLSSFAARRGDLSAHAGPHVRLLMHDMCFFFQKIQKVLVPVSQEEKAFLISITHRRRG